MEVCSNARWEEIYAILEHFAVAELLSMKCIQCISKKQRVSSLPINYGPVHCMQEKLFPC